METKDFLKEDNLTGINLLAANRELGGKPITKGMKLTFVANNWLGVDSFTRHNDDNNRDETIKYAVAVSQEGCRVSLSHILRKNCGLDKIYGDKRNNRECITLLDNYFAKVDGGRKLTVNAITARSGGGVAYIEWGLPPAKKKEVKPQDEEMEEE